MDTFVSLRPFIRCKQILIYYSHFHLQFSPLSQHTEGKISEQNIPICAPCSSCTRLKQHRILINFPSYLCVYMGAGMREGRGAVSLCSKRPAVEDLMALSVQSLVGSLTGYRCLLRDGFIPNEFELQQGCTQSSTPSILCLFAATSPTLSVSLSQH